jgi:hypothetical protein
MVLSWHQLSDLTSALLPLWSNFTMPFFFLIIYQKVGKINCIQPNHHSHTLTHFGDPNCPVLAPGTSRLVILANSLKTLQENCLVYSQPFQIMTIFLVPRSKVFIAFKSGLRCCRANPHICSLSSATSYRKQFIFEILFPNRLSCVHLCTNGQQPTIR